MFADVRYGLSLRNASLALCFATWKAHYCTVHWLRAKANGLVSAKMNNFFTELCFVHQNLFSTALIYDRHTIYTFCWTQTLTDLSSLFLRATYETFDWQWLPKLDMISLFPKRHNCCGSLPATVEPSPSLFGHSLVRFGRTSRFQIKAGVGKTVQTSRANTSWILSNWKKKNPHEATACLPNSLAALYTTVPDFLLCCLIISAATRSSLHNKRCFHSQPMRFWCEDRLHFELFLTVALTDENDKGHISWRYQTFISWVLSDLFAICSRSLYPVIWK